MVISRCGFAENGKGNVPTREEREIRRTQLLEQCEVKFRPFLTCVLYFCVPTLVIDVFNVFKRSLHVLFSYLLQLILLPAPDQMDTSVRSSGYPTPWKYGQVTPVFKNGDENLKSNYRQITVLVAFNNVFERILFMQLCDFFQDKLSPYLSAHRKHYSCQTALPSLLEELRTALDSKEHAAMVGIDLSKAFDCLPHELLLSKLKAYGLSENSVKFLASYLTNRFQRVKIGDAYSSWLSLHKGVPQGSVLGPL